MVGLRECKGQSIDREVESMVMFFVSLDCGLLFWTALSRTTCVSLLAPSVRRERTQVDHRA